MDVYYLILMHMHMNLGLLFKCNTLRINMLSDPKKKALGPKVNSNESIAKIQLVAESLPRTNVRQGNLPYWLCSTNSFNQSPPKYS